MAACINAVVDINVMTVHSAKGLEFPLVVLAGLEEGLFPNASSFHDDKEMEEDNPGDILIEPGIESFVEEVLPKFFNLTISSILLESVTSEHAARTAAMDNATRNADDILRDTTILFNKTRQAYITTELMDIVNGAEAIK